MLTYILLVFGGIAFNRLILYNSLGDSPPQASHYIFFLSFLLILPERTGGIIVPLKDLVEVFFSKACHNMMLSPPCFTAGIVFFGMFKASSLFLRAKF